VAPSWEQIVERVEQRHPSIAPFLAMGRVVSVEADRFVVAYPRTATVAMTRIQTDEAQRVVADICRDLLGRPMRVQVAEAADADLAGPTVAQVRAQKERANKEQLLRQTRSHPLVKQAAEIFGSEVVDVRPGPHEEKTS
jgi:DNA polymerase III subunit gamma/tau